MQRAEGPDCVLEDSVPRHANPRATRRKLDAADALRHRVDAKATLSGKRDTTGVNRTL